MDGRYCCRTFISLTLMILCSGSIGNAEIKERTNCIEIPEKHHEKSNCTEIKEKHCEKKSKYHDPKIYREAICSDLNFCECPAEHCFIENREEWSCLIQKARMMDDGSKSCHNQDGPAEEVMPYVEVCVFVDENFVCNPNCTETTKPQIECLNTAEQYRETCTPSLMYTSPSLYGILGVLDRRTRILQETFMEYCLEHYEKKFGIHEVWYYFDRAHYNNKSLNYGKIMPISRLGDVKFVRRKLCPQVLPLHAIILITVFTLLFAASMVFFVWKFRQYQKHQDELWDGIEECVKTDLDRVDSTPCPKEQPQQELYEESYQVGSSDSDDEVCPEQILLSNLTYSKRLDSFSENDTFPDPVKPTNVHAEESCSQDEPLLNNGKVQISFDLEPYVKEAVFLRLNPVAGHSA